MRNKIYLLMTVTVNVFRSQNVVVRIETPVQLLFQRSVWQNKIHV